MTDEISRGVGDDGGVAVGQEPRPSPLTGMAWQQWWRVGVIGGAAVAGGLALLAFLSLLARPLLLLFAAIVIANALAPVVAWIERRLPRTLAVVVVYLVLLLGLAGFGWVVAPRLVDQTLQVVNAAPSLVSWARTVIAGWDPTRSNQIMEVVQQQVADFEMALVTLPLTLLSALVETGFVLLMSAYWLLSAPALRRFALSLLPEQRRPAAGGVLAEIGEISGGYVRSRGVAMVIVGAVSYTGLRVIGVDFPLVLALIAAVSELIPIVGVYIATVPAVAIAWTESPTQALIVLIFYVLLQQIESEILLPAVVRQQTGIPPILALFALFAGERLAGILGALVAIPLAGAVQVLIVRVAAPALRRWTDAPVGEA